MGKKKEKGKKDKGEKKEKKEKTEAPDPDSLQKEHNAWPWEAEVAGVLGKGDKAREALRATMRSMYMPGSQKLLDETEWSTLIMNYKEPYHARSELMVQLLVAVLAEQGNKKHRGPDLSRLASAVRCSKREQAFAAMADLFETKYLALLDDDVELTHFFAAFGAIDDIEDEVPNTPFCMGPFTRTHVAKALIKLDCTFGNVRKLKAKGREHHKIEDLFNRTKEEETTAIQATFTRRQSMFVPMEAPDLAEAGAEAGADADADAAEAEHAAGGEEKQRRNTQLFGAMSLNVAVGEAEAPAIDPKDMYRFDKDDGIVMNLTKLDILKERLQAIAADGDSILDLWNSIDTNNSGDIAASEWEAHVRNNYSILYCKPSQTKALRDAQDDRTTGDTHKNAYSDTSVATGGSDAMGIKKTQFRRFLYELFKYTEIYYAFAFLDHGDERDNRVTEDEFAKNGKSFFDALGYTAEETAELDMHEEFAIIAGEDNDAFGWENLVTWYNNKIKEGVFEDEVGLWVPDDELSDLAGQLAQDGRPFDFDSMLDVLMVCHYNTRVSDSS